MVDGLSPTIYSGRGQLHDFVHIHGVVSVHVTAVDQYHEYSVSPWCGRQIAINELTVLLDDVPGSDLEPEHGPAHEGKARHLEADISHAGESLGCEPSIELSAGFEETVVYFDLK